MATFNGKLVLPIGEGKIKKPVISAGYYSDRGNGVQGQYDFGSNTYGGSVSFNVPMKAGNAYTTVSLTGNKKTVTPGASSTFNVGGNSYNADISIPITVKNPKPNKEINYFNLF